MRDLIKKALGAKRESKYVEFKHGFDPNSPGEWCEVIKDIVAIANSGGGIIVFGLDSQGTPTKAPLDPLAQTDPADLTNRISKYTGAVELQFEICELQKAGQTLIAFVIQSVSIPIVFQKPGTYDVGSGKQKSAFGVGTVYFRHGAKSEPGNTDDIRSAIERQLEIIRKSWIKGVRKVVQAPQGSQIVTLHPTPAGGASAGLPMTVRAVKDPKAIPVLLTRDHKKAVGSFVHEEVSEGLFDEINNVVDVNRILAKGQQQFLLGPPVYYRIYAERHHVSQVNKNFALLFHSGIYLYSPALFWALALPEEEIAQEFAHLYLYPKSPQIHVMIRAAVLLGEKFCEWLYEKWHRKWKHHAQPPTFYFSFNDMISKLSASDARIIAARVTPSTQFELAGESTLSAKELLDNPGLAASLLSKACMRVFQGDAEMRSMARHLDYFAYGLDVYGRAAMISKAIMKAIGNQEAGDFAGTDDD